MADAETPVTVLLREEEIFEGEVKELKEESPDLKGDLTNGVSSMKLKENAKKWQVFTRVNYHGATVTVEPGRCYNTLTEVGLDNPIQSIRGFSSYAVLSSSSKTMATKVTAILYEDEGYGGKLKELNKESQDEPDLTKQDFTSGVSSIILKEESKKWEVFTAVNYHGTKVTLEPGRRYRTLDAMGLDNSVKSMRRFPEHGDAKESDVNVDTQ